MYKFQVPCDFNGETREVTFYLREVHENYYPLYHQNWWLRDEHGGLIPDDVLKKIAELYHQSEESEESFLGLCYSELGSFLLERAEPSSEDLPSEESSAEEALPSITPKQLLARVGGIPDTICEVESVKHTEESEENEDSEVSASPLSTPDLWPKRPWRSKKYNREHSECTLLVGDNYQEDCRILAKFTHYLFPDAADEYLRELLFTIGCYVLADTGRPQSMVSLYQVFARPNLSSFLYVVAVLRDSCGDDVPNFISKTLDQLLKYQTQAEYACFAITLRLVEFALNDRLGNDEVWRTSLYEYLFKTPSEEARPKNMKYKIPCYLAGKNTKTPYDLYVSSPGNEFHPLHYQQMWLQLTEDGMIPNAVMSSFKKLHRIAIENDCSFVELCNYALESADEEKTQDTEDEASVSEVTREAPKAESTGTEEKKPSESDAETFDITDSSSTLAIGDTYEDVFRNHYHFSKLVFPDGSMESVKLRALFFSLGCYFFTHPYYKKDLQTLLKEIDTSNSLIYNLCIAMDTKYEIIPLVSYHYFSYFMQDIEGFRDVLYDVLPTYLGSFAFAEGIESEILPIEEWQSELRDCLFYHVSPKNITKFKR